MTNRKQFEEFCRRTRPPMSTGRELCESGWGEYANNSTQAAWRAWQYQDKKYNPSSKADKPLKPAESDDTTIEEEREDAKKVFVRTNTKQGQSISLDDMLARYEQKP